MWWVCPRCGGPRLFEPHNANHFGGKCGQCNKDFVLRPEPPEPEPHEPVVPPTDCAFAKGRPFKRHYSYIHGRFLGSLSDYHRANKELGLIDVGHKPPPPHVEKLADTSIGRIVTD
jgi:hypothetical protein